MYNVVHGLANVPELLCDLHIKVPHVTWLGSCFYARQLLTVTDPVFRMSENYNNGSTTLHTSRIQFAHFVTSLKNTLFFSAFLIPPALYFTLIAEFVSLPSYHIVSVLRFPFFVL